MYRTVAERTGAELVIDTSKAGLWGLGLLGTPGIDLDVIHLVRDSRGFALSNSRPHDHWPPGTQTIPVRADSLVRNWDVTNLEAEYLARGARPAAVPSSTTRSHARPRRRWRRSSTARSGPDRAPIHDGELTVNRVAYTVGGNPSRPRLGTTEIRPDERWRTDGSRSLRVFGPVLTGPLWHHYRRRADSA